MKLEIFIEIQFAGLYQFTCYYLLFTGYVKPVYMFGIPSIHLKQSKWYLHVPPFKLQEIDHVNCYLQIIYLIHSNM